MQDTTYTATTWYRGCRTYKNPDMRRILLSIIVALHITACGRNTENADTTFSMDSFERITVPDSAGTKYHNDSIFLGNPHIIRFHPDGYLVLADVPNADQITVIDLQSDKVQSLVKHGRGPAEIMSVRDLAIRDGDIWVTGIADQKIIRLTRGEGKREFEPASYYRAKDQFLRAVPFTKGRILTLASSSSGNRFHILDSEATTRDTVGSFPSTGRIAEVEPNNAIFQSDITVAPNGEHTAAVCQSLEYIDIYDAEMGLTSRLHGPQGVEPAIKAVSTGLGTAFHQDPLWLIFNNPVSDNDRLMIGYIGIRVESEEDFARQTNTVLSFGWDGKPLKAYEFESDIVSFDMDWKNNRMYCLANRPEPEILVYDLGDLE